MKNERKGMENRDEMGRWRVRAKLRWRDKNDGKIKDEEKNTKGCIIELRGRMKEKKWRMKNIDEKKNMRNGKENWRNESRIGMERLER